MDNVAINKARIVYYGLFSSLLAFNMTEKSFETAVQALEILSQNPIDEQSELAFANMQRRLTKTGYSGLLKENNRVFCNPMHAPVPTTASFYHDGRDDGPKRVEMIDYVLKSKYRRNADSYKEHEDHIEFVMLFLQKLIAEELGGNAEARKLASEVFGNIYNIMIDAFTDNLFAHEQSFFYKQVALALRSFTEFERLYLNIGQPEKVAGSKQHKPVQVREKNDSGGCIKMGAGQCV